MEERFPTKWCLELHGSAIMFDMRINREKWREHKKQNAYKKWVWVDSNFFGDMQYMYNMLYQYQENKYPNMLLPMFLANMK